MAVHLSNTLMVPSTVSAHLLYMSVFVLISNINRYQVGCQRWIEKLRAHTCIYTSCLGCGREFAKRYLRQGKCSYRAELYHCGQRIGSYWTWRHRYAGRDTRRTAMMVIRHAQRCASSRVGVEFTEDGRAICTIALPIYPS